MAEIATKAPTVTQLHQQWQQTRDPRHGVLLLHAMRTGRSEVSACRGLAAELLGGADLSPEIRAAILSTMASVEKDAGFADDAVGLYLRSVQEFPTPNAFSNLLMTMNYASGYTHADYLAAASDYADLFGRFCPKYVHGRIAEKPFEDLRIGFISGDFKFHALSLLMRPVLESMRGFHHNLVAISTCDAPGDEVQLQYKRSFSEWHDVSGLDAETTARRIFDLQLDVLVDLSGHTARNMMPALLMRPAPVQVGWLSGMMCPPATGSVDFFIAPDECVPAGAGEGPETILRVPCTHGYDPSYVHTLPATVPADTAGYVTFGSLNNPCKLNQRVLDAWVTILEQSEKTKLLVKVFTAEHSRRLNQLFARRGLSDRVDVRVSTPRVSDVQELYQTEVDIALDTWPCGGCLTTAEALWCGCPVISLRGDTFSHLQSWGVLKQIPSAAFGGTTSVRQYIDTAVALAGDLPRLRTIRLGLRKDFAYSPLLDAPEVASNVLGAVYKAHTIAAERTK